MSDTYFHLVPDLTELKMLTARKLNAMKFMQAFHRSAIKQQSSSEIALVDTKRDHLCRIQTQTVKQEAMDDYRELCKLYIPKISEQQELPMKHLSSFKTTFGDQNNCTHMWKYEGKSYSAHGEVEKQMRSVPEFIKFREERAKMIKSSRDELLFEFGFWPEMVGDLSDDKIYELRRYNLQPGTLLQWASEWNVVMKNKVRSDQPVGGFYTDIGQLFTVYHLWAYENLEDRVQKRNMAWNKEGDDWQKVVANTQVLCTKMESSILEVIKMSE